MAPLQCPLDHVGQGFLHLLRVGVLEVVDIVVAFNFSYQFMKKREDLRNYFKHVKASLKSDGMFAVDIFGGTEADSMSSPAFIFLS